MATKKAASTTKKASVKKAPVKKQATTKVTTVKAVEARPTNAPAAASRPSRSLLSRINRAPLIAALIAEFIGTFLLAATVIAGQGQPILVLFALAGIALAIGALSGSYVNPALTVAGWVTKRLTGLRALGYIVAQVLGAMLALVLLNSYVQSSASEATSMFSQATLFKAAALPAGKEWLVLGAELVGTIIFGFAFAAATRMALDRTARSLTIGLGLYVGLMVAGSMAAVIGATAVLNPAVAVALQGISFNSVWPIAIYGLTAIVGATIGFLLQDFLASTETNA